ncbi:hypothetical protein E2C01_043638 [Portunus trituberculatus]|uniref:Uncharacterized protein n=1 Tax=Portunus trituberculatus TaxID=210409 RepID=A0A5B7G043_PORTR|nr:hypothetical protein [Portunus trituberculatus]
MYFLPPSLQPLPFSGVRMPFTSHNGVPKWLITSLTSSPAYDSPFSMCFLGSSMKYVEDKKIGDNDKMSYHATVFSRNIPSYQPQLPVTCPATSPTAAAAVLGEPRVSRLANTRCPEH